MEKIVAEIEQWPFLTQLPGEIAGFTLTREMIWKGAQYRIFSYENLAERRKFSVFYDRDTKDYMVNVVIGLTEYRDMFFIVTSLGAMETVLKEKMEITINKLAAFDQKSLGSVFNKKKIVEWSYQEKLKQEIAGFTLYIKPSNPIRALNGSYIIIDYSDFESESNFVIFYNVFRDDFFGEIRVRRTPQMTSRFDAKELSELAAILDERLENTLMKMRQQI